MRGWPEYAPDEIDAVVDVLRSGLPNYWGGQVGRKFEHEFAAYHGVPFAVAVANGSLALELALIALGVGAGDEVIVTPRTFVASASSIVIRNATPVFADVDASSQNVTPETVAPLITKATRAIMLVHLAGWPCDMAGFRALADEHGLALIEDCAQAHGATWQGQLVGSFGDAAAFSFCTDKIMTTGGEGGMLLLKNEEAWRCAWSYKDHGKDWDAVYQDQHPSGYRWLHKSIGSNWRLTEMQSAIGRVQLGKLDAWVRQRRRNASILQEHLSACDSLRVPWPADHEGHAFYRLYAFVDPGRLRSGWSRDRIVESIAAAGVPCWHGVCPEVYREEAFVESYASAGEYLPVARTLGETSVMFPVHPTLSEDDMHRIGVAAADVMRASCQT